MSYRYISDDNLDDLDVANVGFWIEPKRIRLHALEQIGWQYRLAVAGAHRTAHPMQTGRTEAEIELVGVIGDIFEVMLEVRLIDELVAFAQGVFRFGSQGFVAQQQQPIRLLAEERLAQGMIGVADHAVATGQGIEPVIHRAANLKAEHLAWFQWILADQTFYTINAPRDMPDAGDHLGFGEQMGDQRHFRTP